MDLTANETKTRFRFYGSGRYPEVTKLTPPPYGTHVEYAEQLSKERVLGIYLANRDREFEYLISKITASTRQLRRLRFFGLDPKALRAYYRATVESHLRLAAPSLVHVMSAAQKSRLDAACKRAACYVFGAFKTSPVLGTFRHSALLLPTEVMHQAAVSVYLALDEDPFWRRLLKTRPAPRLSSVRFTIFSIYVEQYISDLRKRDPSIQRLQVEPLPPTHTKYEKPVTGINTEPGCESTTRAKINHLESDPKNIVIYTDGSYTDSGKAGAGYLATKGHIRIEKSISSTAASAQSAEVDALHAALLFAERTAAKSQSYSFHIFSDSLGTIASLAARNFRTEKHADCYAIFRRVSEKCEITLAHIPAHVGIDGNETADRLAKAAAEQAPPAKKQTCPLSTYRKRLHHAIAPPPTSDVFDLYATDRTRGRIALHAQTGCIGLNEYLHKIGVKPDPNCDLCKVPETIDHVRVCPKYATNRAKLKPPDPNPFASDVTPTMGIPPKKKSEKEVRLERLHKQVELLFVCRPDI
jgi:ribonuclease HI